MLIKMHTSKKSEKKIKKSIDKWARIWYSNIAVAVGDRLYIEK